MHWAVKLHKEHEDLAISVPGLSGLLIDRMVYTDIDFHFKLSTNPYTC